MSDRQQCRLCHSHHNLKRSHILPEFLYKSLYSDKRRLIQLSVDTKSNDCEVKYHQKGIREKLLCGRCETKLSNFEGYAKRAYFEKPDTVEADEWIRYSNLDYHRLKLFQLSILWRVSISSLANYCQVRLASSPMRTIRKMLADENPGAPNDFPCLVKHDVSGFLSRFMAMPSTRQNRSGPKRHAQVYIPMGQQMWIFEVIPNFSEPTAYLAIQPTGELFAAKFNFKETPLFRDLKASAQDWPWDRIE